MLPFDIYPPIVSLSLGCVDSEPQYLPARNFHPITFPKYGKGRRSETGSEWGHWVWEARMLAQGMGAQCVNSAAA